MLVLGIDPGLQRTGFACLRVDIARPSAAPSVRDAGHIKLNPRDPLHTRLAVLERELASIIASLGPDLACVESLFAHYRHPTTAISMAHARGVILCCLARTGLDPLELKPTEVKRSLTGFGHASKDQVQRAIQAVLGLATLPEPSDVADAMAVAYCAACRANVTRVKGSAAAV